MTRGPCRSEQRDDLRRERPAEWAGVLPDQRVYLPVIDRPVERASTRQSWAAGAAGLGGPVRRPGILSAGVGPAESRLPSPRSCQEPDQTGAGVDGRLHMSKDPGTVQSAGQEGSNRHQRAVQEARHAAWMGALAVQELSTEVHRRVLSACEGVRGRRGCSEEAESSPASRSRSGGENPGRAFCGVE